MKIINKPLYVVNNSADLSSFVNTSLVDLLTEKIRGNIYSGRYPAGHKLIVRELSEEFSVSHTPVKDALNRLIAEGYIEAQPRRSMVVRCFTYGELIEKLEIRLMFEIFAADEIVSNCNKDKTILTKMADVLAIMNKRLNDNGRINYEEWVSNEVKFHFYYMQGCQNKQMMAMYEKLGTNKITYLAYLGVSHTPLKYSTLKSNFIEHQAIYDALEIGNVKGFINAVIRHIHRACDDYAVDEECRKKIKHLKELTSKFKS